jgi:hypothetical protein
MGMRTLDAIAASIGTDQEELRAEYGQFVPRIRCFIRLAFTEGHSVESIMDYIDRSETMVTHALRMTCMDMYGGEYGRTLADLRRDLR